MTMKLTDCLDWQALPHDLLVSVIKETQDYKQESPYLFIYMSPNMNSYLHEQQALTNWTISPGLKLIFRIILGKYIFPLSLSVFLCSGFPFGEMLSKQLNLSLFLYRIWL